MMNNIYSIYLFTEYSDYIFRKFWEQKRESFDIIYNILF